MSPARGGALQRRSGSSHRRQHPELARLHLFTWSRNRRRSVALHLRRLRTARHQQGRTQPARGRPAYRTPSHDRLHQRRRGRRAPPRPRTAPSSSTLPRPPPSPAPRRRWVWVPNVSRVLMPDVWLVSQAPRSRGEPHRVRRAARGYLAAAPFFADGASFLPAVSGALAFRMSSANVRWLASSCSAKS
jgi:hypothetical protein